MGRGCASYPDSVIPGKALRAADPEGREGEAKLDVVASTFRVRLAPRNDRSDFPC